MKKETVIPNWHPQHPPIYDIQKSYAENAEYGPFFTGLVPKRPKAHKTWDFLGHKVNSRLGVPAGPLLNSNWIFLAAKLGFDILTYKTIRSFAYAGHPVPNIIYVNRTSSELAQKIDVPPKDLDQLSITNSFGMPSRSPDFLLQDIERAEKSLSDGQVMVVSVVGTPGHSKNYLDDFIQAAAIAKNAGAKIIEVNYSCPNVDKAEGCLYMSPQTVAEYTSKIVQAIKPLPLILKVGKFTHAEQMKEVFIAAAKSGARAISGLNSVSVRVMDGKKSALGDKRETSGICGASIRKEALEFIKSAHEINRKEKLGLTIIGVGGIMLPEHFDLFFTEGAGFAMTATGMMWDPYLAMRYHQNHEEKP